jgi:hypothetical protein
VAGGWCDVVLNAAQFVQGIRAGIGSVPSASQNNFVRRFKLTAEESSCKSVNCSVRSTFFARTGRRYLNRNSHVSGREL